jgi:hypothetical protein
MMDKIIVHLPREIIRHYNFVVLIYQISHGVNNPEKLLKSYAR